MLGGTEQNHLGQRLIKALLVESTRPPVSTFLSL